MTSTIKALKELLSENEIAPPAPWQVRAVHSEECLSYVAWNEQTKEALLIDPKLEDLASYQLLAAELRGCRWLAVIDTHTHADHVSAAAAMAEALGAPLVMHSASPTSKAHLRVCRQTMLVSQAAPVEIYPTPGHTKDSLTIVWGPYCFAGDTVLFGDSGRDDLPGGDPEAHYESLALLKKCVRAEAILLPGHDNKGGRASSWKTQLGLNGSLRQERDDFVRDSRAFDVAAPALLKVALRENFR